MFIECSSCNSKYLVNSADLKPDGRMVECVSCGNQWFQDPVIQEKIISTDIFEDKNDQTQKNDIENINRSLDNDKINEVKNLPSTIVKENEVSFINSILVILILVVLITSFILIRSYGINLFVLINFYIQEFYFNLKLIINDIATIIHQIIN